MSAEPLLSLYTFAGGVVSIDPETRRLLPRPAGLASTNLAFVQNGSAGQLYERQLFGAHRLRFEREGVDRLRVLPMPDTSHNGVPIEIASAAHGRVTLRWGDAFLTAAPTEDVVLASHPQPELSSFWLLEPGAALDAPVSILRREQDGEAAADDFLPNLRFPQIERLLDALIGECRYGTALDLIFRVVHSHYLLRPFHGRSLFVPGLDRSLFGLSGALLREQHPVFAPAQAGTRLIVASELYPSGGHTRVVEDLARLPGRTKIIVTDCFGNFAAGRVGLGFLVQRLPGIEIAVMARATLERKARVLLSTVAQYGPSEIFLLGHHQDPIPSASLASEQVPYRRVYIHHTDHNISLGATCDIYQQVHVTNYVARVVEAVRGTETEYLPLCVSDLGSKPALEQVEAIRSTVTSGGHDKYSRSGPLSYAGIVHAILSAISGDHFHIGPLGADWIAEIRRTLDDAGIASCRFKYLGIVPSVWQTLLDLDAQVYVTSAPSGGGRAAIEAQGAGYPVLFYSNPTKSVLTQVDEIYADKALGWRSVEELGHLLLAIGGDIPRRSRRARGFYEKSFSDELFAKSVERFGLIRKRAEG